MPATDDQIKDLAEAIQMQAQAIADDRIVGPRYAVVKRLAENVDTLAAWIGDDR
jgi:hypothetical protein